MSKLPETLELLFQVLNVKATHDPTLPLKNYVEAHTETFINHLETVVSCCNMVIEKITEEMSVFTLTPVETNVVIKRKGHEPLSGAVVTCEQAVTASNILYKLTGLEKWIKINNYYSDLHALVKVAHETVYKDHGPFSYFPAVKKDPSTLS